MRITGPIPPHVLKLMPQEERKPLGKAGKTNEEIEREQQAKTERQLQDNISRLLRLRGITFFWQRMDRKTSGIVGWPDFTFAVNGTPCAFECKLPGQKQTAEQVEMMNGMRRNGWQCYVIFSEREAVDALNELEKRAQERVAI